MILVTGSSGFLGSHLVDRLEQLDYEYYPVQHNSYDLRFTDDCQRLIHRFKKQIDCVIHLAANVGGIGYNRNHPYQLLYDNVKINTNLIHQCVINQVPKMVMMSTTCLYPKFCPSPFNESSLWDGYPEETNAPYGNAKRIALEQLKAAYHEFEFNGVTLIPTNMFGARDNFNPNKSHVIPALIKKVFDAIDNGDNSITVWGTGQATRDFLYVSDCVDAIILAMEHYDNPLQPLNVGTGKETSIELLVHHICKIAEFKGKVKWDTTKPDGQPKRALNISLIKNSLDWQPKISLFDGLLKTIEWYKGYRYNGKN
jgi:nucleoside-diphosphate-sugar epimerase